MRETGTVEHQGELEPQPNKIAVLDAGSQYGGLIDRNIREAGYRTSLLPIETSAEELADYEVIIISGGPNSVYDDGAPDCDPAIFETKKPILGICYGMQLIAKHLGGIVEKTDRREDGPQQTVLLGVSKLFADLDDPVQRVLMSHGDCVSYPPQGFRVIGGMDEMVSAIEHPEKRIYGVQFHPEVYQTECGSQIFDNLLQNIAGLEADYTIEYQEREAIQYIRETVGDNEVAMFLSGGVDSTVLAALMAMAIEQKDRIHAFHIDTGFMREGESEAVMTALADAGIDLKLLDMTEMFSRATTYIDGVETPPLNQVTDPQKKRKIIGDSFVRVRDLIIRDLELDEDVVLAQGSLRPDLIESGSIMASSKADTIKTHHNDTEEVRKLRERGLVVEPLQALYKDQVRQLGRRLGLPENIVARHPFPGPGLAIRILCEAGVVLDDLDHKVSVAQQEVDAFLWQNGFGNYKAVVLPVRSVGVQGDGRSYKPCVSVEGPTDWLKLRSLADTLPNHVQGINRVCYNLQGDQSPDSLKITKTFLEHDAISQVRQADRIANEVLAETGVMGEISQMPVVLIPISFDCPGERSIVIRPFISPDFMTGISATPGSTIDEGVVMEIARKIKNQVEGISRVLYDLSNKPPGTTEWE